jgi:hypothetical protein
MIELRQLQLQLDKVFFEGISICIVNGNTAYIIEKKKKKNMLILQMTG